MPIASNLRQIIRRCIAFSIAALFVFSITYDYKNISRDLRGKAIEAAFITAYPAVKIYREYIARIIKDFPNATWNKFYPLLAEEQDETIVSVNFAALIDLRHGPVTVTFPDLPIFDDTTITFIEWDGIALGGEDAHHTQYTVAAAGSQRLNLLDTNTLVASGGTVLAFLRFPASKNFSHRELKPWLKKVTFSPTKTQYNGQATLPALPACDDQELDNVFIACMEALIAPMTPPPELIASFNAHKVGAGARASADEQLLWDTSVQAARQMIDQTITNGISLVTTNMWITYEDLCTLKPNMVQTALNKAAFIRADFISMPNNKMKYGIKRYNARGDTVDGLAHDYRLHFNPAWMPSEVVGWHFMVRDHRRKPYQNSNKISIDYSDSLIRQADGSMYLYFSTELRDGVPASNWLPIPPHNFELVFYGRSMVANPEFDHFEYLEELEITR